MFPISLTASCSLIPLPFFWLHGHSHILNSPLRTHLPLFSSTLRGPMLFFDPVASPRKAPLHFLILMTSVPGVFFRSSFSSLYHSDATFFSSSAVTQLDSTSTPFWTWTCGLPGTFTPYTAVGIHLILCIRKWNSEVLKVRFPRWHRASKNSLKPECLESLPQYQHCISMWSPSPGSSSLIKWANKCRC